MASKARKADAVCWAVTRAVSSDVIRVSFMPISCSTSTSRDNDGIDMPVSTSALRMAAMAFCAGLPSRLTASSFPAVARRREVANSSLVGGTDPGETVRSWIEASEIARAPVSCPSQPGTNATHSAAKPSKPDSAESRRFETLPRPAKRIAIQLPPTNRPNPHMQSPGHNGHACPCSPGRPGRFSSTCSLGH